MPGDHHTPWRSPAGSLYHFYWYHKGGRVYYRLDDHSGVRLALDVDSDELWPDWMMRHIEDIWALEQDNP